MRILCMKMFQLVCLAFLLYCTSLSAQKTESDSLLNLLQTSLPDSLRIEVLLELASSLEKDSKEQAKEQLIEALNITEKISNPFLKAQLFHQVAKTAMNLGAHKVAMEGFKKAKNGFEAVGEILKAVNAEMNMGLVHEFRGAIPEATTRYLNALKKAESLKDTNLIVRSSLNLMLSYLRTSPVDTIPVQKYAQLALSHSLPFGDTSLLAKSHLYMGTVFLYKIGTPNLGYTKIETESFTEQAIYHYQISIELYKSIGNLLEAANVTSKLGNVFGLTGHYEKALELYLDLYREAEQAGDRYLIITANINIGGIYSDRNTPKSFREAIPYYKYANELAMETGRIFEQTFTHQQLAIIYENLNLFELAHQHQKVYMKLRDSTLNEEKVKQLAEMETRYETEKKELKIAAQETELAQKQKVQAYTFGGLILLGMVAFLLFRTARLRRRSNLLLENHNRELAQKNTEIETQKFKIEEKNAQNVILLKEIHHRVKNNLQVISSLLNLQSKHIHDAVALDAVKEGQSRVKSMALIHQQLYQRENLAAIEMNEYAEGLLRSLAASFGARPDTIQMINEVEKMEIDVDTAIPLGLIINELVTNSLKYAFPDGRKGSILLSFKKNIEGHLCLEVKDDGVGFSKTHLEDKNSSFGSELLAMLTKKLKGELEVVENEGTCTSIVFQFFVP